MKKKILMFVVFLLGLAVLITPVMAIGPENAVEKNPNIVVLPYGIGLYPPDGTRQAMNNEWIQENPYGYREHDMWMDAVRYHIGNALFVPNTQPVFDQVYNLDNQNKWLYLNQDVFAIMLAQWGFPSEIIPLVLAQHPQGIYYKWNLLGPI